MSSYKAYIGRSSYHIPYDAEEDLQELVEICKKANILVNTVLSQDRTATNEFAILLVLINIMYEAKNTSLIQGASPKVSNASMCQHKIGTVNEKTSDNISDIGSVNKNTGTNDGGTCTNNVGENGVNDDGLNQKRYTSDDVASLILYLQRQVCQNKLY